MQPKTARLLIKLILLGVIVSMFVSCASSNYSTSPCWKGKEPRHRTTKMRA
jgi:hypothetical protein